METKHPMIEYLPITIFPTDTDIDIAVYALNNIGMALISFVKKNSQRRTHSSKIDIS